MTAADTTEYLTAFQLRRAVCQALLEQSRRQKSLIEANAYDQLIELLNVKQDLLNHFSQLARAQSPLRSAWLKNRDQLPAADRACCDAVLDETQALLSVLISEEQACSQRMTVRRDATERDLQSLSVGVQTQHAYQPVDQPVLSRFDLNT